MNQRIKKMIIECKRKYIKQGFVILGVFGSYARDEENINSDVDILYEVNDSFQYRGLQKVYHLELIREELKSYLGKDIDIINKNSLGDIGKKHINF